MGGPRDAACDPQAYDAWYRTPRGRWIGDAEFRLIVGLLRLRPGETLLDVGCGTGYFTRRLARASGAPVVGVDCNIGWLDYARRSAAARAVFVGGRAEALPFADRSFDACVSITALCFVADQARALREMVRVTRRRLVLGLLNRRSLLERAKGRDGGRGAYRGAYWHTREEIAAMLHALGLGGVAIRSAIFLPSGGPVARAVERCVPARVPFGGFLAAAADIE